MVQDAKIASQDAKIASLESEMKFFSTLMANRLQGQERDLKESRKIAESYVDHPPTRTDSVKETKD